MRSVKFFLSLCALLINLNLVRAQPNLYALTPRGGANNSGTILKFDANNKSKSPVKSFDYFDGTYPQASLANSFIKASDGLLYGTVPQGGNYDRGMIVSYDPATGIYTPKYHFKAFDGFNPADGQSPIGRLVQATDGKLYGVTLGDYADVKGSIYSFDPVTLTYTTLKVFDQPNDPVNSGSLIQASNGKLYGMGGQGGANSVGVIYSYDISISTYTNLYHFETTNANMPSGNLLEENGKLFGISSGGGDNSGGAIFRFNPETTLFSSIYSFGAGANDPNFFFSSSLSKAANGKFYGMSFMGGTEASGTIFSLDPTNFAFVKEYDFTAAGINYPTGNFILGSDGKLYGTASGGGTYNGGAVFAFDPSNAGVTVLANLGSGNFDAKKPMGTLAEANGYLYGISEQGGFLAVGQSPTGLGTAYKVKLDGTNLETFHSFGVNTTGAHGSGGMIKVGNLLYGLTQDGGSKGGGTLFSYNPVSAELTVLHNFLDITDDGLHPYASLLHVNGKLYGTTQNGGKHAATGSDGVIFSYDIQNQTYEIVHNCGDIVNDGYFLISTLIKDPNSSKIYGMSELGGTGDGTIFSFDSNTPGSYKIEYSFPGGDGGSSPYGSLAIKNGVLYGTTISGGTTNDGNLFSYDPGTSIYTNLASFDTNPASFSPFGSSSTPLIGSDGNIYLLTKNGGEFQLGTLSKYDFQTKTLSRIKDFKGAFSAGDDKDGAYPAGDLMTASDGKIYGMTTNGGNPPYPQYGLIDQGTIFSYDISTNTFQGEAFLDQAVGVNPAEASFLVEFDTAPHPLDSDSDGIADETDIDDDNDGITDDAENGEADLLLLNPGFELTNPLVTTGAGAVTNPNMVGWKTSAQDASFEVWQNGFLTVPAYEGNQFIEINGNYAATVYQDFASTPGAVIRWTFAHRGRSGVDVVKMKVGPTVGTMVDITTASDGNSAWGVYTGVYTVPAGQTSTRIAFESVSSSNGNPTYGNFLDGIKFEVEPAFRDTDGDGIVNRLDLDSDGDGCSDAKEGGATTSTTSDYVFTSPVGSNGLADELETTVDNGKVKYTSTYVAFATDATKNACKTKPTFTIVASACSNNPPSLPLTSDNGVSGTWNPAQVNKASTNTTKYVFTPSDLTKADTASATIAITLYQKPAFTSISSVCLGATAPTLPATSNNGITGTWTPSTINTAIANTTKYVFVPSPGGPCIDTASFTIVVAPCCVANVDDKYENNGSTKLAKTIALGTVIEANIKNKMDDDYYKFTTTTAGYYTISFTPKPGSVFRAPKVQLYTGKGYEIKSCSTSGKTSYTIKLNAKTSYYVEVEDEILLATACYTLVVSNGSLPSSTILSYAVNVSAVAEMESNTDELLRILPNPTVNSFKVFNIVEIPLQLRVLDELGRVQQKYTEVQPGTSVDFGSGYDKGIYFLQAIGSTRSKTYKLVKQ